MKNQVKKQHIPPDNIIARILILERLAWIEKRAKTVGNERFKVGLSTMSVDEMMEYIKEHWDLNNSVKEP